MKKTWQERTLELYSYGHTLKYITAIIEDEYNCNHMYDKVRGHIRRHGNEVELERESAIVSCEPAVDDRKDIPAPAEKRVAIQNQEPKHHTTKWDGTRELKFAIMGDTQFGSKYAQITYLNDFYDLCEKQGIHDVYHTGDITDGLKMRVGHEYELYVTSADDMLDDVIKNYPKREGITTHFITGNHDASIYKQVGYDIGRAIENARSDMEYLGRDCAVVNLTPNCTLELRHPWDGTAYALSYKIQKMIEAMESDSKPNILAVGHYHKAEYIFYRNIHALQTGSFQAQTPFTRGKGISVNIGGWLVSIRVDEEGHIQGFAPEFVPFYFSIKDDYKNFKR